MMENKVPTLYKIALIGSSSDVPASRKFNRFMAHNANKGKQDFRSKPKFDVPGRPVISNSGYFTENISAFVDYHLQPLARQVKSYIKDTNDFLRKLDGLENLPKD